MTRLFTLALSVVLLLNLSGCARNGVELDQAIAAGQEEGRVVLAYFTAEWCGPCQRMKRDTWSDPRIVEWIEANANLHEIDLDRQGRTADSMGVRGIPTIIAFTDGNEADRITGYRGPEDFLEWLTDLTRGE